MFTRRQFLVASSVAATNRLFAGVHFQNDDAAAPIDSVGAQLPPPPYDYLNKPVGYGRQDIVILSRPTRVYFPSDGSSPPTAPIRTGKFPVVVFCHGQRNASDGLCPAGMSDDFRRWDRFLGLMARCGFIVLSPRMQHNGTDGAYVNAAYSWLRNTWSLRGYVEKATLASGRQAVALIGHSWGLRVVSSALQSGLSPMSIVIANGTWDQYVIEGHAGQPTLIIAGTNDELFGASMPNANAGYSNLSGPKYEVAIRRAKHWSYSEIYRCDETPNDLAFASFASELCVVFFHKHLYGRTSIPGSLWVPAGLRPNVDIFLGTPPYGMRVRWRESAASTGDVQRGWWLSEPAPW